MAKLALVAAMSRREHVEAWKETAGKPEAEGEGAFWFKLKVPKRWRDKLQKLVQQGEAEFWLKHDKKIVVKADLLGIRWALGQKGILLPEEWKDRWAPEPKRPAPTWLLLRNLHTVDEPYQPPSEVQKPSQGVFGVVRLEPDVHEHLREDQQLPNGVPSLVRYFGAKGFQFDEKQVAAFYAALKTRGFVILSGLSGTGKTKLAQLFAELLCPKCSEGKQDHEYTHLFLSVRPDWRDSKALLGYYNSLTERYESTPLLEFLLRAARDYKQNGSNAQPYFVILDEMNLAHVEYYFADFLSVLESGRNEEGWTKESLRLERIGNLPLPPKLYIVGTVNIDETTYMFSPKVLDRAFTLEFREVNFSNYPPEQTGENWTAEGTEEIRIAILEDLRNGGKFCAVVADKDEVKEALQDLGNKKAELVELNGILQLYDLHFGYRVLDEIALFVQNAKNAPDVVGKLGDDEALDYAMLMKVLPKFHGPRQKLEKPLREVLKWAAKETVPDWANWVKDTSKPLVLDQVTKALTQWERLEATQQQTQQEAGQGADRQAEQPANAQQGQDNQTETIPDQATQGEANDQSGTSTKQPFKDHFRYPNTAKKVLQMLRQLYETGFASFAQ